MIVPNFFCTNNYHFFNIIVIIIRNIVIFLLLLLLLLLLLFFFLTAQLFLIGRQNYRANYFIKLGSKTWSSFFFTEVTLWKVENTEEAMCKVPISLLHKLFPVKWGNEIFL